MPSHVDANPKTRNTTKPTTTTIHMPASVPSLLTRIPGGPGVYNLYLLQRTIVLFRVNYQIGRFLSRVVIHRGSLVESRCSHRIMVVLIALVDYFKQLTNWNKRGMEGSILQLLYVLHVPYCICYGSASSRDVRKPNGTDFLITNGDVILLY